MKHWNHPEETKKKYLIDPNTTPSKHPNIQQKNIQVALRTGSSCTRTIREKKKRAVLWNLRQICQHTAQPKWRFLVDRPTGPPGLTYYKRTSQKRISNQKSFGGFEMNTFRKKKKVCIKHPGFGNFRQIVPETLSSPAGL